MERFVTHTLAALVGLGVGFLVFDGGSPPRPRARERAVKQEGGTCDGLRAELQRCRDGSPVTVAAPPNEARAAPSRATPVAPPTNDLTPGREGWPADLPTHQQPEEFRNIATRAIEAVGLEAELSVSCELFPCIGYVQWPEAGSVSRTDQIELMDRIREAVPTAKPIVELHTRGEGEGTQKIMVVGWKIDNESAALVRSRRKRVEARLRASTAP